LRSSNRKLKPLPPHPFRHQDSVKQLNAQSGESAEWPSDAAFREAWLKKPAYDLGNAKLVHILARLNETYLTGKVEPLSFEDQPSIEHLLPRDWIEHWALPGGADGMTDSELIDAAEDDPRAFATETTDADTFSQYPVTRAQVRSNKKTCLHLSASSFRGPRRLISLLHSFRSPLNHRDTLGILLPRPWRHGSRESREPLRCLS
jgi:Protein of unknown function (DUF1524)